MTCVWLSWNFPICKQILLFFFNDCMNYLSSDSTLAAAALSVPQLPFLGKGKKSVHFWLNISVDVGKINPATETAEWSSYSWLSLYLIALNMLLWTCSEQKTFLQWCLASNLLNFISEFDQYLNHILCPGITICLWLLPPERLPVVHGLIGNTVIQQYKFLTKEAAYFWPFA